MTRYNLTITRGDDYTFTLTFKDDAGTVINITGWTVFLTVKSSYSLADVDAKISKMVTSHSDPTNGQTQISLTATDTDISPATYVYDIQAKTDAGKIYTVLGGSFIVQADVTRRIT